MRPALLGVSFVLGLAGYLCADSNLRIADVGLHGYLGTPSAVLVIVRNPAPQAQMIQLRVAVTEGWGSSGSVTSDLTLGAGEERQVELPLLIADAATKVTADATAGGSAIGHDSYSKGLRRSGLVVLMCDSAEVCKATQSQIQFSGSVEDRADKNRQLAFEVMDDAREDWWAYSAASGVVLAMPLAKLQAAHLNALEGYLRRGGRLILAEREIADPDFLAAYRQGPAPANGERVGKGVLFRVASAEMLGDVFAGRNLPSFLNREIPWYPTGQVNLMRSRFATVFNFPQLRWMLLWLTAYIVVIGVANFVVLRRLRLLEFGWISTCGLALIFAGGFYYSGASRRPRDFRLDNLATYTLDGRSALAAADYNLRVSTPERRNIVVSVADTAVFVDANLRNAEAANSQIWTGMNGGKAARAEREDVLFGPPRQVELSLLKWSFRDLDLEGMHEFPGTVHFVAANRLRNDTGRKLVEPVYLDYEANKLYAWPTMAPGEEVQLDALTPKAIREKGPQTWISPNQRDARLQELVVAGPVPFNGGKRVFAAFSDGPALPADLNLRCQQDVHSLIVVYLEQP